MRLSLNADRLLCVPSGGILWDGFPPGGREEHV